MSILKHCDVSGMKEELSILQDRCRDLAVSVRKQALQSLTELLMVRCSHRVSDGWYFTLQIIELDEVPVRNSPKSTVGFYSVRERNLSITSGRLHFILNII